MEAPVYSGINWAPEGPLDEATLKQKLEAAHAGDASAQCKVAAHYETQKELLLALHWYRKSFAGGNEQAAYALALAHEYGNMEVERSMPKAVEYVRFAAKRRWAPAVLKLAQWRMEGLHGIPQDQKAAADTYEALAAQRDKAAMKSLSRCYLRGMGRARDPLKSLKIDLKCETPDMLATKGLCFLELADPKFNALALKCLCVAASKGSTLAPDLLANAAERKLIDYRKVAYDIGMMSEDRDLRLRYFRIAAERKHGDAAQELGLVYEEAGNEDEARKHYISALKMPDRTGISPLVPMLTEEPRGSPKELALKELALAATALEACAVKGDFDSMMWLARCCLRGWKPVAQNPKDAIKWYTAAAKSKHPDAHLASIALGECYLYGWGVELDYAAARRCFEAANAQAHLGLMHYHGLGCLADYAKAFALFQASVAEYPAVSVYLGECYELGRGVARNEAEAAKWYSREDSAEALYRQSERALAAGDTARAIERLEHAAKYFADHSASGARLALLLAAVRGAERDAEECKRLLGSGCRFFLSEDTAANFEMGMALARGENTPPDAEGAFTRIKHAAELGYPPAMVEVGRYCAYGIVPSAEKAHPEGAKDRWEAALHWWLRAARAGSRRGQEAVAECYAGGYGTERDAVKAAEWRARAATNTDDARWYRFALLREAEEEEEEEETSDEED